jgi:hypothetical protein
VTTRSSPRSSTHDYRQFGDIHIPTKITTRVGDIDQVITLLDVVLNVARRRRLSAASCRSAT